MSDTLFYNIGCTLINHSSESIHIGLRRFKAFFGVSPNICSVLWGMIKMKLPSDYKEIHLLWALFFLKCYNPENVTRAFTKCDEKTLRKRVWTVVKQLAIIKTVRLFFLYLIN